MACLSRVSATSYLNISTVEAVLSLENPSRHNFFYTVANKLLLPIHKLKAQPVSILLCLRLIR